MAGLLDIIGGTLIGGMILLIMVTSTETSTREFVNYNADAIVQNNMSVMVQIIESDIRKIGFAIGEDQKSTIIQIGQASHIKFLVQLNFETDMVPDTIEYKITTGETVDYGFRTFTMYKVNRKVTIASQAPNSIMIGKIGNLAVFKYLDQIGHTVANPKIAKTVEVTLIAFDPQVMLSPGLGKKHVENKVILKQQQDEINRLIRPSFWRQTRLVSKNLKR